VSSFHLKKLKILTVLFCLLIVIFPPALLTIGAAQTDSESFRSIDLYTQKEPYSGRGPNQPSNAFAPQEEVLLYAYVTYRDDPVAGKLVAFNINGPANSFENLTFTQTAVTNTDGVANVSFRLTWPNGHPKEAVFGVWNAIASVDIAEVTVTDTMSFQEGNIIELVKVETVDINNFIKTTFLKGEQMYFRLTVRNIAMTYETATFIIDTYDNLSVSFGQVVLADKQLAPGMTVLFVEDLLIPESAAVGDGIAYANAYTALPSEGGIPWSSQVSTTFSIIRIPFHDVAVINVVPSVNETFPCHIVNVSVIVKNKGNLPETFDVSAYYDSNLIETIKVEHLGSRTELNLTFKWDTCSLEPGNYTLSAVASIVPEEMDIDNNRFVDGVVQIKPLAPPPPSELLVPKWLLALLFLLFVLLGAILVLLIALALWCKRKKQKDEDAANLPRSSIVSADEYSSKAIKTCSNCGRQFNGIYTFCPYCMSFHGKDYEQSV